MLDVYSDWSRARREDAIAELEALYGQDTDLNGDQGVESVAAVKHGTSSPTVSHRAGGTGAGRGCASHAPHSTGSSSTKVHKAKRLKQKNGKRKRRNQGRGGDAFKSVPVDNRNSLFHPVL